MEPSDSHQLAGDRRASTTASAWRPLRGKTFRDLLIANVFSDVGAFMQSVGAAWLMISLKAGLMYVSYLLESPNEISMTALKQSLPQLSRGSMQSKGFIRKETSSFGSRQFDSH
jgi:transmembrane secretion effector